MGSLLGWSSSPLNNFVVERLDVVLNVAGSATVEKVCVSVRNVRRIKIQYTVVREAL